ncbi:MAG TPA: NTP transferase domain-containing protein [Thermomicrobiales bacterium]|nr:NTP transferase domain-containing protein [Thermomicrobiales bacterium]
MTAARVAAIVLAAGSSSRLGRPKQLLPVGQTPLLQCTLNMVRQTTLEPRILVLGGYADDILRAVDPRGFDVVHNPDYASGQASSLRAGLTALPAGIDAAAVILGDQPLVPPWLLDELASAFEPQQQVAVRPEFSDGPGNPVILGRELFPALLALEGDVGARDILRANRDRVLALPVPNRMTPRDVDTMADFEALLLDWSSTGAPDVPRYCQRCGAEVGFKVIHQRLRPACPVCGFTYYYDPKVATAVVVEIDGKVVLQQRAIDPGIGKWTFPGGFVERGEPVREAAVREILEEVGVTVAAEELTLTGVYSEPGETVILVAWYVRADGQTPRIADRESTAVQLFAPDALPDLAFPRNVRVLADARRLTGR